MLLCKEFRYHYLKIVLVEMSRNRDLGLLQDLMEPIRRLQNQSKGVDEKSNHYSIISYYITFQWLKEINVQIETSPTIKWIRKEDAKVGLKSTTSIAS